MMTEQLAGRGGQELEGAEEKRAGVRGVGEVPADGVEADDGQDQQHPGHPPDGDGSPGRSLSPLL